MEMEQEELWDRIDNPSTSDRQSRTTNEPKNYSTTSKVQ